MKDSLGILLLVIISLLSFFRLSLSLSIKQEILYVPTIFSQTDEA